MAKLDKNKFFKIAKEIKQELNLDVSTIEEMDAFKNNEPEKYQMLVERVEKALDDSVVGGSFENLSEEEMSTLQGAGDVNAETTPVCFTAGISVSIGISKLVCK